MGVRAPVMLIEGDYYNFCTMETPMLGLIYPTSGVAMRATQVRTTTKDKLIIAFGVRRMHPALAPILDRAAYIGAREEPSMML